MSQMIAGVTAGFMIDVIDSSLKHGLMKKTPDLLSLRASLAEMPPIRTLTIDEIEYMDEIIDAAAK